MLLDYGRVLRISRKKDSLFLSFVSSITFLFKGYEKMLVQTLLGACFLQNLFLWSFLLGDWQYMSRCKVLHEFK